MSRIIDLTKELSEDERTYLAERGMTRELDENAANLMGGGTSEEDADGLKVPASKYDGYKIPELKAEIASRNEGREDDETVKVEEPGNKPELVAALEADDAKNEAAKTED